MSVSKTWSGSSLENGLDLVSSQRAANESAEMDEEAMQQELEALEQWLRDNPETHRVLPSPARGDHMPPAVPDSPQNAALAKGDVVIDLDPETPYWTDAQPDQYTPVTPVVTPVTAQDSPTYTPTSPADGPSNQNGQGGSLDGESQRKDKDMGVEMPSEWWDDSVQGTPTVKGFPQPETQPETFPEVPLITDKTAPRFKVGEHHVGENAIRQRAKRIFTKRVDGSMKVSETIYNEWKGRGQPRKTLEQIFKNCGYDPETFCAEVEILRAEMQSSELVVEGEFLSHDSMMEKGISEQRAEAVKKHCKTNPQKLMRKDPYEGVWMYYVELSVKATQKKASRVEINKRVRFETGVKGMDLVPDSLVADLDEPGLASEDMENIEDQTEQDDKKRHMKSMGLPEIDPDALPSSVVGKYLTAMAKRMTKMQQILDKFSGGGTLTEIQKRLKNAVAASVSNMEAVHKEMSEDYSNGVVTGYSKELEGSLREKLNKAQSLATDSLALEARSRPFLPKAATAEPKAKAKAKSQAKAKVKAKSRPAPSAKAEATPVSAKRPRKK